MKKLSIFILAVTGGLLFASCQKDPDTDKLDNNYIVYTNYDSNTDFSQIESFYVIDSILIINNNTNNDKPAYWKNNNSQQIINAYNDGFEANGYIRAATSQEADVILQLSYVNTTYYFTAFGAGPWWNSYPWYWNWGGWGWYYPYSFNYSYTTGSIIAELVDTNAPTPQNDKLTVIWNSYICGLLDGNNLSLSRTMAAIRQAFTQSPYLKK